MADPEQTPQSPQNSRSSNNYTSVSDRTLATAANLAQLLPTTTLLVFQSLSPSFTNQGKCSTSNIWLTSSLLGLCCVSCLILSFTDSFVGSNGKVYYGIATIRGFCIINDVEDREKQNLKNMKKRLRLRTMDFIHAFFAVVVLLSLTLASENVRLCFFDKNGENVKQLLVNLPLGATVLSVIVFLIFPTARRGIGYSNLSSRSN